MIRFMGCATLVCVGVFTVGCGQKPPDTISAETLIGRWQAVTKADADEGNATRDRRTLTGETIAFRDEFRADHTFVMSVEVTGGLMADQVAAKHAARGTWKVVELGRDSLTIELSDSRLSGVDFPKTRVRVVFQTKDRCVFNADSEEAMVLTRIP
jgi:hypothetical protein